MTDNIIRTVNLDEAMASLATLLPLLPQPKLSEQMDTGGLRLPALHHDSSALPILDQPRALLEGLGPYTAATLPESWLPAHLAHQQRLMRTAELLRLHPLCLQAGDSAPVGINQVDGVVAGVLLWALRPMPGPLRTALISRACTHWWGAYFAAQGMVLADEQARLLHCIYHDPRLVAALWRSNPDLAGPLAALAHARNDIWSASIVLHQPKAEQWLARVAMAAASNAVAAISAVSLQPNALPDLHNAWVKRLQTAHPRLAYLTARWSRHTWACGWERLRDELYANAVGDPGSWFHWYRDVELESADNALREAKAGVLWQAELIKHTNNSGQELRRNMSLRLNANPNDIEARLTTRWLNQRGRPA